MAATIFKKNPAKLALKGTITLRYEILPCLKMQTPLLEALRPLHGQIKLSFEAS